MASKCIRRCSTSYVITELPKFKTLTVPNAGDNVEQPELSFTAGGNAK